MLMKRYIGKNVLIRTVTHYWVGKVKDVDDSFMLIEQASWVPNTGRWNEALRTGELAEVEPSPLPHDLEQLAGAMKEEDGPTTDEATVSLGAIVDVVLWAHALPTEPK